MIPAWTPTRTSTRPTASSQKPRTLIIGLGDPLLGDDGLGPAAVERLRGEWDLPPEVELVSGGAWGMNLLPLIEAAEHVILIDAIDVGAEPGTDIVLEHARLPRYLATKLSLHQGNLRDVLALAEVRGALPEDTLAVGLQPARVERSAGLSDALCSRLEDLITAVVGQLEWRDYSCRLRAVRLQGMRR